VRVERRLLRWTRWGGWAWWARRGSGRGGSLRSRGGRRRFWRGVFVAVVVVVIVVGGLGEAVDPAEPVIWFLGVAVWGCDCSECVDDAGLDHAHAADGVGGERDAGADFAKGACLLVDVDFDVLSDEAEGEDQADDAAAYDGDFDGLIACGDAGHAASAASLGVSSEGEEEECKCGDDGEGGMEEVLEYLTERREILLCCPHACEGSAWGLEIHGTYCSALRVWGKGSWLRNIYLRCYIRSHGGIHKSQCGCNNRVSSTLRIRSNFAPISKFGTYSDPMRNSADSYSKTLGDSGPFICFGIIEVRNQYPAERVDWSPCAFAIQAFRLLLHSRIVMIL